MALQKQNLKNLNLLLRMFYIKKVKSVTVQYTALYMPSSPIFITNFQHLHLQTAY